MVELEYNGFNTITFGKYKIAKGVNQIEIEDYFNLLLLPNFSYRVDNNIFLVKNKPVAKKIESEKDSKENVTENFELNLVEKSEKVFVSDLVEEIKSSNDLEKLYKMLDTDKRSRVQKALIERIEEIS